MSFLYSHKEGVCQNILFVLLFQAATRKISRRIIGILPEIKERSSALLNSLFFELTPFGFRTMGAAVPATALRNVLNADTTLDILSFLDDSSLVITYGSESSDIANLEDVGGRYGTDHILPRFWERYNRSLQRCLYGGSLEYPYRM